MSRLELPVSCLSPNRTPARSSIASALAGSQTVGAVICSLRSARPVATRRLRGSRGVWRACAAVEELFVCSPHHVPPAEATREDGYSKFTPRLVLGTPERERSGLLAMREAFARLRERRGMTSFSARAKRWEKAGAHMRVHLEDGRSVDALKILIAAGVVGSLRLAMASCPEIEGVSLGDHAPHMLYVAGMKRRMDLVRSDGVKHFNSLSIERRVEARTRLSHPCIV